MRADIQTLIQTNNVCVLATASEDEPHCSLMSYAADKDCREIYMITQRETKKYHNLKKNPSISLLIDTRQTDNKNRTKALTISGTFQSGIEESRKPAIKAHLLESHPDLKELINDPTAEIIVLQVKALQLLDGIKDSYFETVA